MYTYVLHVPGIKPLHIYVDHKLAGCEILEIGKKGTNDNATTAKRTPERNRQQQENKEDKSFRTIIILVLRLLRPKFSPSHLHTIV